MTAVKCSRCGESYGADGCRDPQCPSLTGAIKCARCGRLGAYENDDKHLCIVFGHSTLRVTAAIESSGGTDYQQNKEKSPVDRSCAAGPDPRRPKMADLWTPLPPDAQPTPTQKDKIEAEASIMEERGYHGWVKFVRDLLAILIKKDAKLQEARLAINDNFVLYERKKAELQAAKEWTDELVNQRAGLQREVLAERAALEAAETRCALAEINLSNQEDQERNANFDAQLAAERGEALAIAMQMARDKLLGWEAAEQSLAAVEALINDWRGGLPRTDHYNVLRTIESALAAKEGKS